MATKNWYSAFRGYLKELTKSEWCSLKTAHGR